MARGYNPSDEDDDNADSTFGAPFNPDHDHDPDSLHGYSVTGEDGEISDSALEALKMERSTHPDESEEQMSRRLLRENAPAAVLGIVHTAMHGTNERVRLDAQKYVVERVLGKVGDDAFGADRSPIEAFIEDVTALVRDSASARGSDG